MLYFSFWWLFFLTHLILRTKQQPKKYVKCKFYLLCVFSYHIDQPEQKAIRHFHQICGFLKNYILGFIVQRIAIITFVLLFVYFAKLKLSCYYVNVTLFCYFSYFFKIFLYCYHFVHMHLRTFSIVLFFQKSYL